MGERFIQYAISVFFCAMSVHEYCVKNWNGAFYFLLAAGFLALWVEMHKKNEQSEYNNCSWFINPPLGNTSDYEKGKPKDGDSNRK